MGEGQGLGSSAKKVAFASFIGSAVEWYDFGIYGTAAALIFGKVFFPVVDPLIGTLAAFATFGIGFVARPLGGVLAGHFGDRIGRKFTLVASLLIMGIATVAIGLLPGYDRWGLAAPVALVVLRLFQGIGLGAEWGGAVLMTTEHAPRGRRGLYGAMPQLGGPAGSMLATASVGLAAAWSGDQFTTWGWRVPFLASSILIIIGVLIRVTLTESKEFLRVKSEGRILRAPVMEVLRRYPREIAIATGLRFSDTLLYYIVALFLVSYATRTVGMGSSQILGGVTLALAFELVCMPLSAWVSDYVGRKPIFIFGPLVAIVLIFPLFAAIDAKNIPLTWLFLVLIINGAHATTFSTSAASLSELFPTEVRMSGSSIGFNLASLLAAAPAPLIATALLGAAGGQSWPIALYVIGGALITLCAALAMKETHRSVNTDELVAEAAE